MSLNCSLPTLKLKTNIIKIKSLYEMTVFFEIIFHLLFYLNKDKYHLLLLFPMPAFPRFPTLVNGSIIYSTAQVDTLKLSLTLSC